eukprot:3860050-Pyramimonas_sp.AAC.1
MNIQLCFTAGFVNGVSRDGASAVEAGGTNNMPPTRRAQALERKHRQVPLPTDDDNDVDVSGPRLNTFSC